MAAVSIYDWLCGVNVGFRANDYSLNLHLYITLVFLPFKCEGYDKSENSCLYKRNRCFFFYYFGIFSSSRHACLLVSLTCMHYWGGSSGHLSGDKVGSWGVLLARAWPTQPWSVVWGSDVQWLSCNITGIDTGIFFSGSTVEQQPNDLFPIYYFFLNFPVGACMMLD